MDDGVARRGEPAGMGLAQGHRRGVVAIAVGRILHRGGRAGQIIVRGRRPPADDQSGRSRYARTLRARRRRSGARRCVSARGTRARRRHAIGAGEAGGARGLVEEW